MRQYIATEKILRKNMRPQLIFGIAPSNYNSHKDCSLIPSAFVQDLLQRESPEWEKVIEKDLSRTFPFHEMFRVKDGPG